MREKHIVDLYPQYCDWPDRSAGILFSLVPRRSFANVPRPEEENRAIGIVQRRYVIAIGASAGGIDAVSRLLGALPADFAAPIVVAIHSSETKSLPEILDRVSSLPAVLVEHDMALKAGTIHVCPGGMHTSFEGNRLKISEHESHELFRPSIDRLFTSLAEVHGTNGIGVVMSGMLNDGTDGANRLHSSGAITLVQRPGDARSASMPSSAIIYDHPDGVFDAEDLADQLTEIVQGSVEL